MSTDLKRFHLEIDSKAVDVYPSGKEDSPVLYLNTFGDEGEKVYAALACGARRDFTLVTIANLNWNSDMAPWDIPPISKNDTPCTGGADEYLTVLTEKIVPAAEGGVGGKAPWRAIAGYSLAGLFALYSLYRTDVFSRAASISGSLWFPGIAEYIRSHEWRIRPEKVYFSLGDQEARTKNPFLKPVRKNTEEICDLYRSKGIKTVFEWNRGNHYANAVERTAAGILWLLETDGE